MDSNHNPKNKLQEYCQKNGLNLPKYHSTWSGNPHEPQWSTTLEISLNHHNQTSQVLQFMGFTCKSKKEAEKSAASDVLRYIDSITVKKKNYVFDHYQDQAKFLLFIDLENCPHMHKQQFPKNYYVIGFVSMCSPIYNKISEIKKNMAIVTIKKARKDLVDHLMSFYIGNILSTIKNDQKVLIATKDNAGMCVIDILQTLGISAELYHSFLNG